MYNAPTGHFAVFPVLLASLLLLFAGVVAVRWWRGGRGAVGRSLRNVVSGALWSAPVIVVLGLVLFRAVLVSQPEGPRPAPVYDEIQAIDASEARDLPEAVQKWSRGEQPQNDTRLLIVSSGEHPTLWDAQQDAEQRIRAALLACFSPAGVERPRDVPPDALHEAVRRRYPEMVQRETEQHKFTMHRVHLQVALNDSVRDKVREAGMAELRERRLWGLGAIGSVLMLIVASGAAYLRLDRITRGNQRFKLKLAAVSAITLAGLAVAGLMPVG